MIKVKNFFALTAIVISSVSMQAQQTAERSINIIQKGVELHDAKKYDEAISEFKKVHRNDSNYYLASLEILNSYLTVKKNKEGLELCEHLLKLKNEYTPNILIMKGDFLDNLKRHDEAAKIYEQGAKEYPLNHSFYYEHAVSLINQKKHDAAYPLLVKATQVNPFHSSSHYQLGLMAYRNNNVTATMLSMMYYLLCDPTSDRATGTVVDLEKISKSELEIDTVVPLKIFQTENDFSELESILKSKVALTEKYKSKVDLTFDIIKQMQILVENIGKYKDVKGHYNAVYGKFFADLQNEKLFEPFVYYILKGMNIEKVNKWLLKNKSDVDKFELWSYNYICRNFASFPENLNGKMVTVPHWYSNNAIMGAGERNAKGMNHGYWVYYYKNGIKRSEGEFVNGNRNNTWKSYYITGGIKEETVYENEKEKFYKSYYENNNPKVEVGIQDNKIAGEKIVYFSNGNLASKTTYKNGEINGPQTYYYRNGSLRYTIENNKENLNGDLVEYFDNGVKYQTVKFVNSNREGAAKVYYNNAANSLESEGNYVKNKYTGEWKTYYRSGKVLKQLPYNSDGELDGTVKEFYENGQLEEEDQYTNGKLNGLSKSFTEDGILYQEFLYKKGKLMEYRAFKKDGTKIADNKINGKNFKLVLYHPNGKKRREGEVSDGELEGVWKDYNSYGVLIRETSYKAGQYDGKYTEYHENGKLKRERHYTGGSENGLYKSFFINGQLQSEGMIVNGNSEGYWKNYYKDGTLESKVFYVEDDIEGWAEYYDVNGRLTSENLYREYCLIKVVYHDSTGAVIQNIDLPGGNGLLEKKTKDGKTIFKKTFVKDFPDGASTSMYPDGKIETKVDYVKGKRQGKSVAYNPLGILISETMFFNGSKNGHEKEYDDDAKLESDFNYDNGDYHGKGYAYHPNGKVFKDLMYNYGDAEGESDMFDEFGELIYRRTFHNDLLVSYTYKDAKGALIKPMELPAGESKLNCLYMNGKKSIEATYINGTLHGKRLIYFSNGKVYDETNFFWDYRHGESKIYYSTGNVRLIENFSYGSPDGKSTAFYENGKIKWERNYKKGELHGWAKFYDKNGVLLKSVLYYNGDAIAIK